MNKFFSLLVLLLVGCVPGRTPDDTSKYDTDGLRDITVYTLGDGTRCAVYSGGLGGAMHCDWK